MTSKTIQIDVLTARKSLFSGEAKFVTLPGMLGDLGVEPGHAPLMTSIKAGVIRIVRASGEDEIIYTKGGFAEVQPNAIIVLAEEAERADDLDEMAAITAREQALRQLGDRSADFEYAKALAELAETAAQIQAVRKLRERIKH
jgi:F-type H+-transporting ATPase subunit epsilon